MDLTGHSVADSFNHSAKARGETTATLACFATCTIVFNQPQRKVALTVLAVWTTVNIAGCRRSR